MDKKITYTQAMQEQDKLWKVGKEDFKTMGKLYNEIVEEAKKKGFKGISCIYDGNGEKLIEIFESKEQQKLIRLGKIEVVNTFEYCKPLIDHLETILKKDLCS